MNSHFAKIPLPNGIIVYLSDRTRHYFGGFYRVAVEIFCTVTLNPAHFSTVAELVDAQKIVGSAVNYRRCLERMGVPGDQVERVRTEMVHSFTNHSLSYFATPDFGRRLIRLELDKRRLKEKSISYKCEE